MVRTGVALSVQDPGRVGWKRFGVPEGGWLDDYSARWANRLIGNEESAPVLECAWHGARFEVLMKTRIAICGARIEGSHESWRSYLVEPGDQIEIRRCLAGVWTYLAIEGGVPAPEIFGGSGYYARGAFGFAPEPGDIVEGGNRRVRLIPAQVGVRSVDPKAIRNFSDPPPLLMDHGPQWEGFAAREREHFFEQEWLLESRSDRSGYRFQGDPISAPPEEMISEPMVAGAVQIPPSGLPIAVMRDGPNVGGYAKIGIIRRESLDWLAQVRPGQPIRFGEADPWT